MILLFIYLFLHFEKNSLTSSLKFKHICYYIVLKYNKNNIISK